jgi:hypothetical protein
VIQNSQNQSSGSTTRFPCRFAGTLARCEWHAPYVDQQGPRAKRSAAIAINVVLSLDPFGMVLDP